MKLALCQIAMSDNENENLERQLSALRQAALHGADLIVYPELQLHRFFPQYAGCDVSGKLLTADAPIIRQFLRRPAGKTTLWRPPTSICGSPPAALTPHC